MPICPKPIDSTASTSPKTFENWARALQFKAATAFRPKSRGEVVEIIHQAEKRKGHVKWSGSLWSFMGVFTCNDVLIETDRISGEINRKLILDELIKPSDPALVHIKGGTKVFNVNRLLHGLPLVEQGGGPDEVNLSLTDKGGNRLRALPTLGGSGGQSIAGALSTGSHGGDVERSPLADWIQAIHLIGPGGQEFWIERTNGISKGSAEEVQVRLREIAKTVPDAGDEICDGVIVKKDDDWFYSALVSVGRMGFVYSLVVRTVPSFFLREERRAENWETFHWNLTAAALPGYLSGKFFVQTLINPLGTIDAHRCKISERKVLPEDGFRKIPPPSGSEFTSFICKQSDVRALLPVVLVALVALLLILAGLLKLIVPLLLLAAAVAAIPFVGWLLALVVYALLAVVLVLIAAVMAAILALVALTALVLISKTAGDLLAKMAEIFYAMGMKETMKNLFTSLLDSAFPLVPSQDVSWKIMDTYNYSSEDFCQKVDSMEFAFDATPAGGDGHIAFINQAIAIFEDLYQRNVPGMGLIALRFMKKTQHLIGMTKFGMTCHVEIPLLRHFSGNAELLNRLQLAAMLHGGVPHWGQLMATYNAGDVQQLHGSDVDRWRVVLGDLIKEGGGEPFTFSNGFTLTYNLEPLFAGLPDDCAEGSFAPTTLGSLKGPKTSTQRLEGDVTLDRVSDDFHLELWSLHGNIVVKQKVDQNSFARLTACGAVTIGEKIDNKSTAVIWAHGDVTIKQKVDQDSRVEITSTKGAIEIGQSIDQKSRATLIAKKVHIGEKIDENSFAHIEAEGDVIIEKKVDQHSTAEITSAAGSIDIKQKVDQHSQVTLKAKGKVHIGQKIDQHSKAVIEADDDVVIDEGIDGEANVKITSNKGSILIGKAIDGKAKAVLRAPNGIVKVGEKVAGGATVEWAATSFSCPSYSKNDVKQIV